MDQIIQFNYKIPPNVLPAFPGARQVPSKGRGKIRRRRWKTKDDKYILEWDSQHGRIEKYNTKGKHLGEFDPDTGEQTKPANPTRRITCNKTGVDSII